MTEIGNIWQRLLTTQDSLKRRLLFIGWLTAELKAYGIEPILVGGNALQFYTLGAYATVDIDLVCPQPEQIDRLLQGKGFQQEGRHWYRPDIDIAVEIPATSLAGSYQRVETVMVEEFVVHVISKEDLIVDRLNACVHWRSKEDCRWAKELILLYQQELDWEYLEERTKAEATFEKLKELRQEIEELSDDGL